MKSYIDDRGVLISIVFLPILITIGLLLVYSKGESTISLPGIIIFAIVLYAFIYYPKMYYCELDNDSLYIKHYWNFAFTKKYKLDEIEYVVKSYSGLRTGARYRISINLNDKQYNWPTEITDWKKLFEDLSLLKVETRL